MHVAVLDAELDESGSASITYSVPGVAALAADVDQDERVVAAHHLVGEVEAAVPKSATVDARRLLALAQPLRDGGAEAVVAHPEVADARRPGSASRRLVVISVLSSGTGGTSSNSPAKKKWKRPDLAHQLLARVVVDR